MHATSNPTQPKLHQHYSARKLSMHVPTSFSWLFKQVDVQLAFFGSVGAANEDADSQSYAGEWVSRVLIKGSASRGAINQTQDHSYSHSTDHGCYVVFIQLLALCLRDPCSCPGYLTEVHKERRLEIQYIHCYIANLSSVYSHMFKRLQLKNRCHNPVSTPDIQNKQYVHIAYIKQ